jgi:hypothetical protein
VKALLKEFCIGTVALDKDVNARAYGMSTQFRRGIVEGWLEGDGLHRQYQDGESISKGLVKSMMRLCSSIGILSRMTRFKMSGREGHHYRLHLTKEVPNAQLTGLAGVYALPIKRINRNYRKKTRLVDIEVDGDHTFTLADGRVTHNCHTFWNIGNAAEPKLLREKIHDYLVEGVEGVYDKQLLGRHLVRAEYGLYEKAYPKTVHKAPVNAENHFAVNEVPEAIWKSYREEVFKLMLRHIVPRKNVTQPGHMRPCMKYILSPEFKNHKDGGKRAMFIVASYYRALEDAALYELLGAFNRYNLREPYTTRQMEAVVKSVRSHPGRPVGCKFRHDLLLGLGKKDVVDECES